MQSPEKSLFVAADEEMKLELVSSTQQTGLMM